MAEKRAGVKKVSRPIAKFNEHLSDEQREVKKQMFDIDIAIFNGKAGTGKTSLAVNYAYEQFVTKGNDVDKIYITRATVCRKKDNLGFLSGDMFEKMNPWMQPIYDSLYRLEPPTANRDKVKELIGEKKLEIVPLAFVQGRTFTNSIVIIDEYQNLDDTDAEGLFTRLGVGSKMIFCGDDRQSLITGNCVKKLNLAAKEINRMGSFTFTRNFRHPLVKELIEFYEKML